MLSAPSPGREGGRMLGHVLDGRSLTVEHVLRAGAPGGLHLRADDEAVRVMERSWRLANDVAGRRAVYGRTTGVGANRSTDVADGDETLLRLLRSHATGLGPVLDLESTRRAMVVRLNQLLRGGSGMHPGIVPALLEAIAEDRLPALHVRGALGTGDLTALAEMGLALIGELPMRDGSLRRVWQPRPGDALPLISSNAVTIADACGALERVEGWIDHQAMVAALSFVALRASPEPLHPEVQRARPLPGQEAAAARLRAILGGTRARTRTQDSFGFRAYPQVVGALIDAKDRLREVLTVEINAAAENPLVDVEGGDVLHNGNFHGMALGLALDGVKLALAAASQLSLGRLTDLTSPGQSGLPAFLADATAGSSGVMLVEYVHASAQSALRHSAQPATLGSVAISQGTENHAGFSTQAVRQLRECVDWATQGLACEALAALRAVGLQCDRRAGLSKALDDYLSNLPERVGRDIADRPLTADLEVISDFLASRPEWSHRERERQPA